MSGSMVNLSRPDFIRLVSGALAAAKTRDENARAVADALWFAEASGHKGHGLSRVPSYVAQARTGKVDGQAVPRRITPPGGTSKAGAIMVDAAHGFAYPAIDLALSEIIDEDGSAVAAATIVRSHHCGAMAQHVGRLAEAGRIALMFANTPKAMAPWGGANPVFGTNPIAFAAPRRDAPAVVIDMALSEVARGKILAASQKGEAIPEGWAKDADGRPTRDAKAALSGTLNPAGGAKGAALAMLVEILAVCLGGAGLSVEATSFFDGEGAPPNVGQTIISIDPAAFAGAEVFAERLEALLAVVAEQDGTRIPGEARAKSLLAAGRDGVNVDAALVDEIRGLAGLPR